MRARYEERRVVNNKYIYICVYIYIHTYVGSRVSGSESRGVRVKGLGALEAVFAGFAVPGCKRC